MFKLFVFVALLAVAFAAPKPGLLGAPLAYSAGIAPLAYSSPLAYTHAGIAAAPLAYSAGYASPYAYSAYTGYPSVYL